MKVSELSNTLIDTRAVGAQTGASLKVRELSNDLINTRAVGTQTGINMNLSKSIDFLLENANPSIKRRVKSEILHNLTQEEASEYQAQIVQEPNIKRCFASQLDNGWFGHGFHGMNKNAGQFENQETCTKYLGEKAVDKGTPALKRSMEAFINIPLSDWCYRTKGYVPDEFKLAANGTNLYRCTCIARAGYADIIDISPQIQLSIDSFRRVLEVDSILDVTRSIKSCKYFIFNDYEKWPCRYHLDMLAHTESWKDESNKKIIADSVTKMMRTDRPELFNLGTVSWFHGHAVGTSGCFPSHGFSLKRTVKKTNMLYYHMEYIEWLARCGVVPMISALDDVVNDIIDSIDNDGICKIPIEDSMFTGWGPYAGLQLEVDWKTKTRRDCDITFRALLIAYYAGMMKESNVPNT
ncbi:MAG: hypothetical protein LBM60_07590 [Clostridium sp.]|nr:hypothetical protein [Clostridium sp.]